jgi:hypothetical protein
MGALSNETPTRKKLFGTLIGFALGLYVASALFITFFSGNSFVTIFDKGGVIFVFLIVVGVFSFFGVHCMSDNDHSKN